MNGSGYFSLFGKKRKIKSNAGDANEVLPIRSVFVTSLNLLLCSLLIPFMLSGNETATYLISLAVCLTSTIVMFTSAKKISHAIIYTVVLVLFLGAVVLPLLPALIFGSMVAIGSGAALVSSGRGWQNFIIPTLALLALIPSVIVSGDIAVAATALALYLPVAAMGIASRKKASVGVAVASCAAAIFFTVLLALCAIVYVEQGSISPDTVTASIDLFANDLIAYTELSMNELMEIEVTEAIHNLIVSTVDYYINLSPGLMIATCSVIAYLALRIEHNSLEAHGIDRLLDEYTTKLSLGVVPALLFILALVLSFSLDAHNKVSIVAIIADNVCIILAPGLLVMTSRAIRFLPQKLGFIGLLAAGALILLIILALFSFPMIIALVGAAFVIFQSIDAWAKEHYSKGDNQ